MLLYWAAVEWQAHTMPSTRRLSTKAIRAGAWALTLLLIGGCTGVPSGIEPVDDFEVERYAGVWYEIMRLDHRFERNLVDVTAEYQLREDGVVTVVNRGFDTRRCSWQSIEGTAKFRGAADVGSLAVTFFWPIRGGYHVFALDRDDYEWAMVSGPTRGYLWILARDPGLDEAIRLRLMDKAARLGFAAEDLIVVEHGAASCNP